MNIKQVATNEELQQVFSIRTTVFVNEQHVKMEEEYDNYEDEAIHFIGYLGETPVLASRLRFVEECGKLERICVLKEFRGKSFGSMLIRHMEEAIKQNGYKKAKLNAQTKATNFYQRLGYQQVSGEFLDAGIPHVTMTKELI